MPAKHLIPLLFFFCLTGTTKAQRIAEKKEVLHVVIDSLVANRRLSDLIKKPIQLLGRKTFPMPKEYVVKYIIQSGFVHYEWKDTLGFYKSLQDDTLLTADEFISNNHVFYSNNPNEFNRPLESIYKTDSVRFKGRDVFRVKLTTPVFSEDGKYCWIIVCYGDGHSCYLLKKNNNSWKISEYVGGEIICGARVTAEEYYKLTGKKLEIDFTDDQ